MTMSPSNANGQKLYWSIACLLAIFVVTGFVLFCYWKLVWQFEESTDDAYVAGNRVEIVSQLNARVLAYFADNTDLVQEGALLVQLEPKDFQIALDESVARLAETVREVKQLIEQTKEQEYIIKIRQYEYENAKIEYERRKELIGTGAIPLEEYTTAEAAMNEAQESVKAAEYALKALEAVSAVQHIREHPRIVQDIQNVKQAFLNLSRTKIYAPVTGYVAERKVQAGQLVTGEDKLMSVIPLNQVWVNANFKETQLANIRIGQPVSLFSDMYGSEHIYHGKIVGINGGTGSVFSILPPQNATGNWIKIVQRVPVKVSIEPQELKAFPLFLGLSMTATVDTHDRANPRLDQVAECVVVQETAIYRDELAGWDAVIEATLVKNGA